MMMMVMIMVMMIHGIIAVFYTHTRMRVPPHAYFSLYRKYSVYEMSPRHGLSDHISPLKDK